MSNKIIVCRCEDVTLADITHSIEKGYANIEEVKRYTGFGTGPCQGKECMRTIAFAVAKLSGVEPKSIPPFTARPPLTPTPLKIFARDESAQGPDDD